LWRQNKGERGRGWIQLWYIARTLVNVTMYLQYNNKTIFLIQNSNREKSLKQRFSSYSGTLCRMDNFLTKLALEYQLHFSLP
jgi:hypothetical protein